MTREPNSKPEIDYHDFKWRILTQDLTPAPLEPLNLRLDLLESFIAAPNLGSEQSMKGNDWTSSPGKLIIVDLSSPFMNVDSACALFEICLGVFLKQKMDTGRIVALDEAHKVGDNVNPRLKLVTNIHCGIKFLRESAAAQKLTESLVTIIGLQRHLACRVIIATQEPTIFPKLLCGLEKGLTSQSAGPQGEGIPVFSTDEFPRLLPSMSTASEKIHGIYPTETYMVSKPALEAFPMNENRVDGSVDE